MKDHNPIRTARRNVARQERIGAGSFCLFCGYACLESLTRKSVKWFNEHGIPTTLIRRLLEDHHVVGDAHDPNLIVTLCLTCHREITEGLAGEGVSMRPQRNLRKLIANVLRASAVLFESLASSYRKWASLLQENENEF